MRIQAVFNTDQIGGAERSMVATLRSKASAYKIEAWIPNISGSTDLKIYLEETIPGVIVHSFKIGASYYQVSRGNYFSILKVLVSFAICLFHIRNIKFKDQDIVWLNGNKVGALFSYYLAKNKYQGRVFWHLRDYFPTNKFLTILVQKLNGLRLSFIANSYSVKEDFDYYWPNFKCHVLYNSAATITQTNTKKVSGKIGVVAMLTPWKGIHDVLIMAARNEDALISSGANSIVIYGGEIYHTHGAHDGYKQQLEKLAKKFKKLKVEFAGLVRPQQIFTSIDLLIHSSLRPEPFGRVIIEAMESHIPVVSTGLGGAAELATLDRAWTYLPHHDAMFVRAIDEAMRGSDRQSKLDNASAFVGSLKELVKKQMSEILDA
tara:strand:- start:4991 stop:6118 length:1128 start_codon:yes stop_codon:yes gene_type:complete